MENPALSKMIEAVERHNVADFCKGIDEGFDVQTRVPTRTGSMSFVEKVARSRFTSALRMLLLESCPCRITLDDAVSALHASVQSGAPNSVIEVFIQTSIAGTLPVLNLTESFKYATEYFLAKTAIEVVHIRGFDPNTIIQMSNGTWDQPLHLAIRHDEVETATHLLQVGSEVDSLNSYGSTPLFIACGRVNYGCCKILICHGADPKLTKPWSLGPTPLLERLYPLTSFRMALSCWEEQRDAELIITLLVKAGLPQSEVMWLQRKIEASNSSKYAGQALKEIGGRLLSLKELSVISGRQFVRNKRNGQGPNKFHDLIDQLMLPGQFKKMLKFECVR